MSQFAIFVTIKLKPGTAEAFQALILENAEAAVVWGLAAMLVEE